MKFITTLLYYGSRIVELGSHKYPRRLPADFVPPIRIENFDEPFIEEPNCAQGFPATQQSENDQSLLPPEGIGRMLLTKGIIKPSDLAEAMERKKQDPGKYLGQILAEMGFPQSKIMNRIYYGNKRKKLGEILVDLNFISNQQLYDTLIEQRHLKEKGRHVYLAKLMINNKIISEEHYITALSAHFSMPVVSLKDYTARPSLQKAVGEQYALRNRIIVLNDGKDDVAVAIAEPHLSVFDQLEKAMPRGKYILFHLARESEIDRCLWTAYGENYV